MGELLDRYLLEVAGVVDGLALRVLLRAQACERGCERAIDRREVLAASALKPGPGLLESGLEPADLLCVGFVEGLVDLPGRWRISP